MRRLLSTPVTRSSTPGTRSRHWAAPLARATLAFVVCSRVLAAQDPPAATNITRLARAIVCDESGRPQAEVPQKVQSEIRANCSDYVKYHQPPDSPPGSDYVYRYSIPGQPRRFLYLHVHQFATVGQRVTFWLYDEANLQVSRKPPTQSNRWLDSKITTGTMTNRFGDPYVSFRDITGDGIPEIVSFEVEHGGTDDWQEYYRYYQITPEPSLTPVLTHPAYVCVPMPGKANGALNGKPTPLGNGRLRLDVTASGLPLIRDGSRVATYTCEQPTPASPFALTLRRLERELGAQSWALRYFERALSSGSDRSN